MSKHDPATHNVTTVHDDTAPQEPYPRLQAAPVCGECGAPLNEAYRCSDCHGTVCDACGCCPCTCPEVQP